MNTIKMNTTQMNIAKMNTWIALVAAFIAGALKLLRSLDKGQGVYVSMSWFAPGVFIPTIV